MNTFKTLAFHDAVDGFQEVDYQMRFDLRRRAADFFSSQEKKKSSFKNVQEFEAHRENMRANFLDAIGGLPGESDAALREPPPTRVTGTLSRPGFTVEKIIYESLPNYPVTAALYLPKSTSENAPAIVFVCGHSDEGKAYPRYQAVCIDLVENGFVVLAIDPIAQGERHQFLKKNGEPIRGCTTEHTRCGLPMWLRGAGLSRYFVWDIMRGIDYLQTRPEVDATRIAMTGNSGGGTQTCYTMMCEPRLAAAAPCTFVMTLESYLKTGQPQDAEQIVPRSIERGPDHDDFVTALAPRPVLIGAAASDFFPIEGTQETLRRAKLVYELYGKSENVAMAVAPTVHQYSPQLRQATVNWFRQHLMQKAPEFITGEPQLFEGSELYASNSGEIYRDMPDAKTVFDLERAEYSAPRDQTGEDAQRQLVAEILSIESVGNREAPINGRAHKQDETQGFATEKIYFFSAPDITVAGIMFHPKTENDAALTTTLLLFENGTSDISTSREIIISLLEKNQRVLVFDVRGIGSLIEPRDAKSEKSRVSNRDYRMGCDAMMLGQSTLGMRVFDVLRGFDYLQSRDDVKTVSLHGVGSGAVWAFYAALLEEEITALTCSDMLRSMRELCTTPDYDQSRFTLKNLARNLLEAGDYEELLPLLAPRPVTFQNTRDARGQIAPPPLDGNS